MALLQKNLYILVPPHPILWIRPWHHPCNTLGWTPEVSQGWPRPAMRLIGGGLATADGKLGGRGHPLNVVGGGHGLPHCNRGWPPSPNPLRVGRPPPGHVGGWPATLVILGSLIFCFYVVTKLRNTNNYFIMPSSCLMGMRINCLARQG
jgi:hypothetical protein